MTDSNKQQTLLPIHPKQREAAKEAEKKLDIISEEGGEEEEYEDEGSGEEERNKIREFIIHKCNMWPSRVQPTILASFLVNHPKWTTRKVNQLAASMRYYKKLKEAKAVPSTPPPPLLSRKQTFVKRLNTTKNGVVRPSWTKESMRYSHRPGKDGEVFEWLKEKNFKRTPEEIVAYIKHYHKDTWEYPAMHMYQSDLRRRVKNDQPPKRKIPSSSSSNLDTEEEEGPVLKKNKSLVEFVKDTASDPSPLIILASTVSSLTSTSSTTTTTTSSSQNFELPSSKPPSFCELLQTKLPSPRPATPPAPPPPTPEKEKQNPSPSPPPTVNLTEYALAAFDKAKETIAELDKKLPVVTAVHSKKISETQKKIDDLQSQNSKLAEEFSKRQLMLKQASETFEQTKLKHADEVTKQQTLVSGLSELNEKLKEKIAKAKEEHEQRVQTHMKLKKATEEHNSLVAQLNELNHQMSMTLD